MLTALKGICRTSVIGYCFLALCSTASPAADDDPAIPSTTRVSDVLAEGHELRAGLTSLFTVPKGVFGTYEHGGELVYFETRRGPPTSRLLRKSDPTAPKFEIDVRFMNKNERPFLIQIGGHAPIDETWAEDGPPDLADDARARAEFRLAAKAIETLGKVKFARRFRHEYRALLRLSPAIASARVIEKIEEGRDRARSSATLLSNNTYRHKVEIHHKSCCFGLGRHSATIGKYVSSSGVTTTAVITCNHGSCAQDMPQKCSWTSPGNRSNHVHNHVSCSTAYNPTSVFGHNSNDDTDLQYKAVRENFHPSSTGGTCNDSDRNNYPTSCY